MKGRQAIQSNASHSSVSPFPIHEEEQETQEPCSARPLQEPEHEEAGPSRVQ
jgi:hypothetical protein